MELHRLSELPSDFPTQLFNKLHKETKGLRTNLVKSIDHRRFGVTPDIIESWFDDKFIFVFNKYFKDREEKHLKYSIIQALSLFKCRILRKAYSGEAEIYSNVINLTDSKDQERFINVIPSNDEPTNEQLFFELAMGFLKKELTHEALLVLELQLTPPEYIVQRTRSKNNITSKLLAEYLDLPNNRQSANYIDTLKEEIAITIEKAREYFTTAPAFV